MLGLLSPLNSMIMKPKYSQHLIQSQNMEFFILLSIRAPVSYVPVLHQCYTGGKLVLKQAKVDQVLTKAMVAHAYETSAPANRIVQNADYTCLWRILMSMNKWSTIATVLMQ